MGRTVWPGCFLALGLLLSGISSGAQSPAQTLKTFLDAQKAGQHAVLPELAQEVEAQLDAGQRLAGTSRTAVFGFLAEALAQTGQPERAEHYLQRALDMARIDGDWARSDGLRARFALAKLLLDTGKSARSLDISAPLFDDLQRIAPRETSAQSDTLRLILKARQELTQWEEAVPAAQAFLDISTRTRGPSHPDTRAAHRILSHSLFRSGRASEAIPHAETFARLLAAEAPPNSRPMLEAETNLAWILAEAGDTARAIAILDRVEPIAVRRLPKSDPIRGQIALILFQVQAKTNPFYGWQAGTQALMDTAIDMGDHTLTLSALEEKADMALRDGGIAGQRLVLEKLIAHLRAHPDLPRVRLARALSQMAFVHASSGDIAATQTHIDEARAILQAHPGGSPLLRLETEARLIDIGFLLNGQRPLQAGELEVFRQLTRAYEEQGDAVSAAGTGAQYARYLGEAGRYEAAIAEINHQIAAWQAALRDISARAAEHPNPHVRAAQIPDLTARLTIELGTLLLKAGAAETAVDALSAGMDQAIALQRSAGWIATRDGASHVTDLTAIYGQYYANALWRAAVAAPDTSADARVTEAFEAVQLAGYGPAAAAVARARLRQLAEDPTLVPLLKEWDRLAHFENGAARRTAEIGALQAEIEARAPDYFDILVPETVPLSTFVPRQGEAGLLAHDEALILILPSRQIHRGLDLNGMIVAVTRDGLAWAELGMTSRSLAHAIEQVQSAVDPLDRRSRAPVAAQATRRANQGLRFPFQRAATLYQALFGDPDIAALLKDKPRWTIVPMGTALATPFAALVVSDPGRGDDRDAAGFRAVTWLGLERALTIVPSVAALKDLRTRPPQTGNANGARYLGFGDPAFRSAATARLQTADTLATGDTRLTARALARLPRLPGTRREVETLARFFGTPDDAVRLGDQASEAALRQLDASGRLAEAGIVHFATHGLLAGAFEGLSEPALALTPPENATDAADDGLLTASEMAGLTLSADWVILSACDTAGSGANMGSGLGALVEGFFSAGARSLLVSHWRVDDIATDRLISSAVIGAENGTPKAEALRAAMSDLFSDTSRDSATFSNAHPSIWAPFFVLGGG